MTGTSTYTLISEDVDGDYSAVVTVDALLQVVRTRTLQGPAGPRSRDHGGRPLASRPWPQHIAIDDALGTRAPTGQTERTGRPPGNQPDQLPGHTNRTWARMTEGGLRQAPRTDRRIGARGGAIRHRAYPRLSMCQANAGMLRRAQNRLICAGVGHLIRLILIAAKSAICVGGAIRRPPIDHSL